MSCGADTTANALIASLTAGKNFEIPEIDFSKPEFQFPYDPNSPLYGKVAPLTVEQLTTRVPGGTGVFDALMDTYRLHLREEMEKGRITGAEYTKAYKGFEESVEYRRLVEIKLNALGVSPQAATVAAAPSSVQTK